MASYEGVRETRETVAQTNVLTDAMRRGDFSGVAGATVRDPLTGLQFPNNIIPADRIDPLAVSMVNQYQPLPNQSGANNFRGLTRVEDTQNQYITRIDHVINAKQKIFGHYLYQGRDNPSFPINPEFPVARLFNNHSLAVQHVTTWSSNLLNETRFGYMRGDLNRLSPRRTTGFSVEEDLGIHGMLVGGPNGRPPNEDEIGFPMISIQGFNGFGDGTGGEGIDKSQTYQIVNNTTLIRGRHALKMGADIRRLFGDATSTNAPFGALDFTRDITGHGNNFHLTELTGALCTDSPAIDQNPPKAPFDTFIGTGTGKLNNKDGARIEFVFVDGGEPGVKDTVSIKVFDELGNLVLDVSGPLDKGNQQAHKDNK